ncbi:hybrid-cluster NAD(P)-dependent oxidoreductase [Rhodovulum sp. BSW8]|uniref:Hybrid-cluster NAD(P)-dependent oxidoreductase n=1 Tax=Rhodovulum visakhapatnamense TaxID=364297 RepID=A0ABS1REC7_9RHOB|nr:MULTISPECIES: hybrid-cluster NAD(P)-dependent oxidoreductase [Rhodovulum]MBL3569767.1 hybrid-cluster NAD(P)-dependent oxidoreductase [Rhodovulum visakhapatnamense]MBL3577849.1 hybrid-cluster NAD(P)-dependent oxidoreductase [Rhodovulum visakhapatnamense]OLS42418.1 hybrid-cluster NAD(P)-dependent oxidoreductase [Rhodovulum sulfidophilum]RBO53901.1 hybrid-cluster NAD(P)-dependent oxidoreductase [Rhodovulum sp. BSW8]
MTDLSGPQARSIWSDDEMLECVSVIPEVPNTATFTFQAPSGALFDYLPGQFLTLEIPVPGGTVHRTYTISSSPSRPRSVSVTVKAQAASLGTRWMLDELRPGMRLKAFGPAGVFSHLNHPAAKYLFISAGSGITPAMSMTTFMFDLGTVPDIVFVNCARSPSGIIFRERLEHMASRVPGIDLKWVVERPDPFRPWTGYRGVFNQLMLGLMAPDYLDREVFCCGPEPFMQTVRDALQGLGYDMDRYHQESFQAPAATADEVPDLDDVVPSEDAEVELTFARSGVTARASETDTILAAARGAGLNIPSGCTFGVCGTCKIRKLSGEVHMVHNGGISEDDIAAGYVLACCSHPIGKVAVDV